MMVALFVAALHCSSSFVISPSNIRTSGASIKEHPLQATSFSTKPRGNPIPTSLHAFNKDNQDFQEDLKQLGKAAVNVVGNVGKMAGWVALKGVAQGYRGIKHVIGQTQKNEQVQQGVDRLKDVIENVQSNEQVQQGVERLKNLVGDAQKQVKKKLNKNSSIDAEYENFDTEDENLFRGIPKKRPEVIVDAEVLEGVRVLGGTTENRVIDAEVITKSWSR